MTPEADYEVSGHVPNVVFPCAALVDNEQDRLAIYYGAADTTSASPTPTERADRVHQGEFDVF